jgi:hypothetical protein
MYNNLQHYPFGDKIHRASLFPEQGEVKNLLCVVYGRSYMPFPPADEHMTGKNLAVHGIQNMHHFLPPSTKRDSRCYAVHDKHYSHPLPPAHVLIETSEVQLSTSGDTDNTNQGHTVGATMHLKSHVANDILHNHCP